MDDLLRAGARRAAQLEDFLIDWPRIDRERERVRGSDPKPQPQIRHAPLSRIFSPCRCRSAPPLRNGDLAASCDAGSWGPARLALAAGRNGRSRRLAGCTHRLDRSASFSCGAVGTRWNQRLLRSRQKVVASFSHINRHFLRLRRFLGSRWEYRSGVSGPKFRYQTVTDPIGTISGRDDTLRHPEHPVAADRLEGQGWPLRSRATRVAPHPARRASGCGWLIPSLYSGGLPLEVVGHRDRRPAARSFVQGAARRSPLSPLAQAQARARDPPR